MADSSDTGRAEQQQGHERRPSEAEGDRPVKSAREILEERLARMKGEGDLAEQALKEAAERAPSEPAAPGAPPDFAERLAAVERERDEWKDTALRARADLDNYRKRVRRDMEDFRAFAAAGVLGDVLGAIDNLDLALDAAREHPHVETLVRGVEIVLGQLERVLADRGAERIPARGVPFDPRRHEAVLVEERADVPEGTAIHELRRGYVLKERVLRPAQVKVSRRPAAPGTGTEADTGAETGTETGRS